MLFMEFRQYHDFETLSGLKDDWRELLQQSAIHVPFLTFEYLQAWWQTRGGGEWPEDSQLCMIAAFQDGKLVGIAPLFLADNLRGRSSLLFVGAIEVSDFLDFIVPPANAPDFIHGLLDFLIQQQDRLSWEVIDLYNILEDSPSINILQHEAEQRGWRHDKTLLHPSPYIPLPDDYEAYLAGIDKKQRHEIRRKLRNVEQSPLEGKLYFTESPDSLEADVDAFIEMMAQDPNKRDFLTPTMRQHLRNTARIAFEAGWLQLAFFNLDGRKAAGNLSFNYNNRLWLYNSGWEWDYREYSPGWVLLAYLIQWAVENGIEEFDFMRGNESYKYKFGGIDRHIYRIALEP
jgi:CelD/BcsL family acetyltransferase involved in cellulose biosynthesis